MYHSQFNFTDIIKGKFLEEFTAISLTDAIVAIALAFVLSLFIVLVYRVTYGGVSYSKGFVATLIMLAMVTAVVILVISSNVVLSLGMVGALSIVRFRTAIKEPSDTAFAFWAIATGIICGAGYVTVAVLVTLLLGMLFVGVHAFGRKYKRGSYMVVIRSTRQVDAAELLSHYPHYRLKHKNIQGDETEVVAEVELGKKQMEKLDALRDEPGILEITVMSAVSGSVL